MGRWRWHIVIFARFLWRSSRQWRVSQLRVGPRVGPWVPHRRCSLRQSKNRCTKTKQIKRWDVCSLEQNCIDSETSLFDMIHQLRFERAIHIALTILCVKIIFHQTSLSCIKFQAGDWLIRSNLHHWLETYPKMLRLGGGESCRRPRTSTLSGSMPTHWLDCKLPPQKTPRSLGAMRGWIKE